MQYYSKRIDAFSRMRHKCEKENAMVLNTDGAKKKNEKEPEMSKPQKSCGIQ